MSDEHISRALVVGAANPVGREVARLLAARGQQVDLADVPEARQLLYQARKLLVDDCRSPIQDMFDPYILRLACLTNLADDIEPLLRFPYTTVVFVTRQPREETADLNHGLHYQFLGEILGPYYMAVKLREARLARDDPTARPLTITFVYARSHRSDLVFSEQGKLFPKNSIGFRTLFDKQSIAMEGDNQQKYSLKLALIAAGNALHSAVNSHKVSAVTICPMKEGKPTDKRPMSRDLATCADQARIILNSAISVMEVWPESITNRWINCTAADSSSMEGSKMFAAWLESLALKLPVEYSIDQNSGGFVLSCSDSRLFPLLEKALPILSPALQLPDVQSHVKLLQGRYSLPGSLI